ncbi:hypothetical protein KIW84_024999 [Lathyrus oleraceus]|uniref:Retrovirus-related Pol polyprotein from transposon TNT 1-94 n=1 Tax=Pisum sativum TaxID=3888 RepID=A0A9D5BD85_PEA|nr:hypothetical protein KIW84_024999 [Pisum sativum]
MTTEGSFVQLAISRFDGHYDHWTSGVVPIEAQRKKNDEMKLKDLKTKNYLFQEIERTVLDTILKKDTSKDIWDAMKKKFEGNARVKRSHL